MLKKTFIISLFILYGGWNFFFLIQGKIPASIFRAATGLPCPTTGGVRSFCALCAGEWREAFLWNPFCLIFIFLAVGSGLTLAQAWLRGRPLLLSRRLAMGWFLSLGGAWVVKFMIGPAYW